MRKISIFSILAILGLASASAEVITPEVALARAKATDGGAHRMAAATSPRLVRTAYAAGISNAAPVYLFSSENQSFILSGSNIGEPLLGILDAPIGEDTVLPPAVEYWMEYYSRELSAGEEAGLAPQDPGATRAEAVRRAIEPMVHTKWAQEAPYNNLCPDFNEGKAVTGCLATAMTQVMKFHEWPRAIDDMTKSYTYYLWGEPISVSAPLGGPFDWDNMLDVYKEGEYTEEQAYAVADLMYRGGVAAEMMYAHDASAAITETALENMTKYLDYDRSMWMCYRDLIDGSRFEHLLYRELAAGRPLMYAGQGTQGGHQFVCDGYQGNGLYHFNWGWAGLSDGYFRLGALSPEHQGTGGGSISFNSWQNIIVGMRPARPESRILMSMAISARMGSTQQSIIPGQFAISTKEHKRQRGKIILFNTPMMNASWSPCTITPALELIDTETGETMYVVSEKGEQNFYAQETKTDLYRFLEHELPLSGTYKVYPAWYDGEMFGRLMYTASVTGPLEMTCTKDMITFSHEEAPADVPFSTKTYQLSLSDTTLELAAGSELKITGSVIDDESAVKDLEWAASDKRIVRALGKGAECTLYGMQAGTTKIRAALNGCIVECEVTVTGEAPEGWSKEVPLHYEGDTGADDDPDIWGDGNVHPGVIYDRATDTGGENGNENSDSFVSELEADLPREYYNLQGMRISRPENGIVIEKRGNFYRKHQIR